ncbi:hypothetical protein AAFN86_11610 [Roseomonas sp. CAU 1739]|uniref:hypothetical protein n=1 Tax=Roseomonas sp. CAU 1739 TaxID=3140364 RepID=UPI00325BD666
MARKRRNPVARSPGATNLTPKEAALVRVMIESASEKKAFPTREQLGTLAGYGTGEVARTSACRALARPHVREAIQEGIREVAGVDVAAMYHVLRNAAVKAPSARDKITAASKVLDIAGLTGAGPQGPAVAIQVVFQHGGGSRLARLAAEAGFPAIVERPPIIEHQPEDAP